jgi:hypothetical protein
VDKICWCLSKRHKIEVKSYYHVYLESLSLEEYLESYHSFKSGIFCVDSSIKENIDFG